MVTKDTLHKIIFWLYICEDRKLSWKETEQLFGRDLGLAVKITEDHLGMIHVEVMNHRTTIILNKDDISNLVDKIVDYLQPENSKIKLMDEG